jgi:anti-anti-sigma regulatory factor
MAIAFRDKVLSYDNITQQHMLLLEHLNENPIIIYMDDVESVDLATIQLFLSLKKYCELNNIELKFENIGSRVLLDKLKFFKLV